MKNKEKSGLRKIGLFLLVTLGLGASAYLVYEAGCQHGVNTVHAVLRTANPELFEQVDELFNSLGAKK